MRSRPDPHDPISLQTAALILGVCVGMAVMAAITILVQVWR